MTTREENREKSHWQESPMGQSPSSTQYAEQVRPSHVSPGPQSDNARHASPALPPPAGLQSVKDGAQQSIQTGSHADPAGHPAFVIRSHPMLQTKEPSISEWPSVKWNSPQWDPRPSQSESNSQ